MQEIIIQRKLEYIYIALLIKPLLKWDAEEEK
jgi:hypothetical protein